MTGAARFDAIRMVGCPDGCRRAVVRDGDRLTLVDLDDGDVGSALFVPADIDRLVTFAERAAAGDPVALTHPKAVLFLATLALALVAAVDDPTNRGILCPT